MPSDPCDLCKKPIIHGGIFGFSCKLCWDCYDTKRGKALFSHHQLRKEHGELAKLALDGTCTFGRCWQSRCGSSGWPLCSDHLKKRCKCGKQATHECGHAGALCCGRPLCPTCECPSNHPTERHHQLHEGTP